MRQKKIAIILIFAILLQCIPIPADGLSGLAWLVKISSAEEKPLSGTIADGKISWKLEEEMPKDSSWSVKNPGGKLYKLTISGEGEMPDYDSSKTAPWYAYHYYIQTIVVNPGITKIGAYAFYDATNLSFVQLPDTITIIGKRALTFCKKITTITLPEGVCEIGEEAFYGDESLQQLNLPQKSLKTLGYDIIAQTKITEFTIPASVESFVTTGEGFKASNPFNYCGLQKISMEAGNTKYCVKDNMLIECKDGELYKVICYPYKAQKSDVVIPDGVKVIGAQAFSHCQIVNVKMADSVQIIKAEAFDNSQKLSHIDFSKSLESISGFSQCWALEEVDLTVAEKLKSIESHCFEDSALKKVILPSNLQSIGNSAFFEDENLIEIDIPSKVSEIGSCAFSECKSLKRITLPVGLKSLGEMAFENDSALTKIEIPEGIEEIFEYTFSNCSSLEQVHFPQSLKKLGSDAFLDCISLTEIDIPDCVTDITWSFRGCSSLKSVHISESATRIIGAFAKCKSLTEVVVPNQVTELASAFQDCTSLKKISLGAMVNEAETELYLGDVIIWGLGSSFEGCIQLREITVTNDNPYLCSENGVIYNYEIKFWNGIEIERTPEPTEIPVTSPSPENTVKPSEPASTSYPTTSVTATPAPTLVPVTPNVTSAPVATVTPTAIPVPVPVTPTPTPVVPEMTASPTVIPEETPIAKPEQSSLPTEAPSMEPEKTTVKEGDIIKQENSLSYLVTDTKKRTVSVYGISDANTKSVTIPDSIIVAGNKYQINAINKKAFKGRKGLKEINLGANIQKIGASSFNGCSSLECIVLPKKVKRIGANAFRNCKKLKYIILKTNQINIVGERAFQGTSQSIKIKTPKAKKKYYKKIFRKNGNISKKARYIVNPQKIRYKGKTY